MALSQKKREEKPIFIWGRENFTREQLTTYFATEKSKKSFQRKKKRGGTNSLRDAFLTAFLWGDRKFFFPSGNKGGEVPSIPYDGEGDGRLVLEGGGGASKTPFSWVGVPPKKKQ